MEGRKVSDRGFYASVASPKRRPSASNCLHTTAINSGIPMNCSQMAEVGDDNPRRRCV